MSFSWPDDCWRFVRKRCIFRAALLGKFSQVPTDPVTVATGCSIFPKEILRTSRRWAEKRFTKLVYFNELEKGGHFAAFEQPETFVREVRACFRQIRQGTR
jgi:epoxide hydrolase